MPEEDVFCFFYIFFPILHSHIVGVWISKGWHCSESFILARHSSATCIGRIGANLPLHLDASLRHQHRKEEHPFRRTGKKAGGPSFQPSFNHRPFSALPFFFVFLPYPLPVPKSGCKVRLVQFQNVLCVSLCVLQCFCCLLSMIKI